MINKSLNELLDIAKSTSCEDEMDFLQKCGDVNIRRVLAKNTNISEFILEKLLRDPVQNVSYIASLHNKANKFEKKIFTNLSACVLCEKEEKNINCISCNKLEEHRF